MHDHLDDGYNPARGIAYGLLLGGLGWLLLGAIIAFADEPRATCTVTQTVDDQYWSSCGPPAEPSREHTASPS